MTETERTMRLIEFGYFDFFGLGTDIAAAEAALEAAARIDADSATVKPASPRTAAGRTLQR